MLEICKDIYICELGWKKTSKGEKYRCALYQDCVFSGFKESRAGKDKWGYFYNFTGNEAVGHCFWCGVETKHSRRYCCKQHRHLYLVHFSWIEALDNVCRRIYDPVCKAYTCEKCNNPFMKIEIHHIIPLNGGERSMSILNRPDNLLGLCSDCHKETHRMMFKFEAEQKAMIENNNRLIIEKRMLEIQPELF